MILTAIIIRRRFIARLSMPVVLFFTLYNFLEMFWNDRVCWARDTTFIIMLHKLVYSYTPQA